ncbi:MAG TPA: tetratricopeptide repeat protein [Elusimicrobiota bacterium]|nr:tetratricopeptide repeat protein [Elusimicrobiota bacterium]
MNNPHYRGLGWIHLRWMWTSFHMGHYMPVTWMSLGLDHVLWGMNPAGYHLTSLLLHAVNAGLFYFLALRLLGPADGGEPPGAAPLRFFAAGFSALFFSLHPLRVESVAWVTERRDVVSGLFCLVSLLFYLRYVASPSGGRARFVNYIASFVSYAVCLLSRANLFVLPLLLLVLDVYPLRRFSKGVAGRDRLFWEKVPFALIAAAAVVWGLEGLLQVNSSVSFARHGIFQRLALASFSAVFYVGKTVFPLRLSPLYEIPLRFSPWEARFVVSGAVVVLLSWQLWRRRRRWPAGVAAWISYLLLIAPTSGLFQRGIQIAADRYSYASCGGWALLAGAALRWAMQKFPSVAWRRGVLAGAAAVSAVLGASTWAQTHVWRDSETLWRHVLRVQPHSAVAHYNLGVILSEQHREDEALRHWEETLRYDPGDADAYVQVGILYEERGRLSEAAELYKTALRWKPESVEAHFNLGILLGKEGNLKGAEMHLHRALLLAPRTAVVWHSLGRVLERQNKFDFAAECFRRALSLEPARADSRDALNDLLEKHPAKK